MDDLQKQALMKIIQQQRINQLGKFKDKQDELESVTGETGVPSFVGAPDERSKDLIDTNVTREKTIDLLDNHPFYRDTKFMEDISEDNKKRSQEIRMRELIQRLNAKKDLENQS